VTEFLNKPINPDEVVLRVRNLLSLRSGMQKQLSGFEWLQSKVDSMPKGAVSQEYERIIQQLCRFSEIRDEETGTHMHRMAAIAQLIAREMGADAEFSEQILLAAPMHDIGKVGIPDKILLKPGKLDIQEWMVMKTHASIGYDFLRGSELPLLKMGADIAHTHHEKFNGDGYPQRLKGEAIPVSGRIVAVADVFDALVNVRPYKAAWDFGDAFNLLRRERGQHFDPVCVDAMLRRIDGVMEIQQLHSEVNNHSGGPNSSRGQHRAVGSR
jgi:response regulator RpfG family c-di-GMP phosphodiesterase